MIRAVSKAWDQMTRKVESMYDDNEIEVIEAQPIQRASAAIARAEFDVQVSTAKQYPRSVKKAMAYARDLATQNPEIAAMCSYRLNRSGKAIEGASIRMAEIMAGAWGNLHCGSRIVDEQDGVIVAEAIAWDVERNVRIVRQVSRRITDKTGKRYNDDMIIVTGNAAAAIALRNAILTVVPKSFVEEIRSEAKEVALGKAKGLEIRRSEITDRLKKAYGITDARIYSTLGIAGIADMGWDHVETLIGLGVSIHEGVQTIEEAFPLEAGAGTPAQPPAKGRLKPATKPAAAPTQTATVTAPSNESPARGEPENDNGTPFDDPDDGFHGEPGEDKF